MRKKLSIIILTLVVILLVTIVGKETKENQTVFINEVRSWDSATTRDGYFGSDYIELYNASEEEISLDGWYLSDDSQDLMKCVLHDVWIGANGFVLIYANGEGDSGDSLNFKLDPTGEKIFLSDSQGKLIDSIFVPRQEFGTVYARKTDGGQEWCVKEATVDFSNNEAEILPVKCLKNPEFSVGSGFYKDSFELELNAEKNQTIYYTLDGSKPDDTSLVYEKPILIENISDQPNVCNAVQNVVLDWKNHVPNDSKVDKAVVVRAIAMDNRGNISDVVTNTYFVNEEQYADRNVISLVADYEDLFGENGIFVTGSVYDEAYLAGTLDESIEANFLKGGRRWEIQGNMQLLKKGKECVNQKVGIRTQGASTRLNPKKRMSIYSREEYSENQYFKGLEFLDRPIHSIVLNSSFSNAIFPELVAERNISVQNALETTVFLNGEYWYDCYTMEKYNKYFLEETYSVSRENVILLKNGEISEGPANSLEIYGELLGYISSTDLSLEENYAYLEQMMDMQSYIDYIAANVYLCNMDMSETKNYVLWRTIEDDGSAMGDGRWRWMLYDIDCLEWVDKSFYNAPERAAINSFAQRMQFTGVAVNEHMLFSAAKNNETFRKQFVLSFLDMANVNFNSDNVERIFGQWGYDFSKVEEFFRNRFDYIVPYMAEEFELVGTLEDVNLKTNTVEGGKIQLNTTKPDLSDGYWTGKYYTDYPVIATAIPEEGYKFIGWKGNVESDSNTIEVDVIKGGIVLEAVFEKIKE